MTEVEQLREDYRKIVARRNSAEDLLAQERAKCFEHMQAIKMLRKEFEALRTEYLHEKEQWDEYFKLRGDIDDADSSGHRDNE